MSSEVSSPGKRRHHILLFEELSSKNLLIGYDIRIYLTLLTATGGCFNFGSISFFFFLNKRCLTLELPEVINI